MFENTQSEIAIAAADGITRKFSGTIAQVQPSGDVVGGSVSFVDESNNQIIEDFDNDGNLEINGVIVGTIDLATLEYDLKFPVAPKDQADVKVRYNTTFDAGDVLYLVSNTNKIPFEYTLQQSLNVGDELDIQDPIQAILVNAVNGGIMFTRNAIKHSHQPDWVNLDSPSFGASIGTVAAFEYSPDGNSLYAGDVLGNVYRYDGLSNLYHPILPIDVSQKITRTLIFRESNRDITGLCLHPTDPEKLLVTLGNYSPTTSIPHVFEISNAATSASQSNTLVRDISGNLPGLPVYDAEYNMNDDNVVLVGTDFGIWSTSDVNSNSVEWFVENEKLANVPVTDIRQQRASWEETPNSGKIYVASYGRGLWMTKDFVSTEDDNWIKATSNEALSSITTFPNPAFEYTNVKFEISEPIMVNIQVLDLNGKLIKRIGSKKITSSNSNLQIDVRDIPAGTYFIVANSGETYQTSKLLVVK